jgi:tetratricopeptide (TPR) repeat protein
LATAHQSNLVHRDIKPDNVMVAKNGHVKVLDFGLAKLVEKRDEAATLSMTAEAAPSLTLKGEILGTPAYMSPEQVRGEQVDSRSDIFSFGVTLYEMVTGRAAFRGPTAQDTLAAILKDEPPQSVELNQDVPAELNRIISRCLHKRPEERYNDTRDLVAALRDLQTAATTPSVPHPVRVQQPRRSGRLVALVAALAAIVALVVVQPWQRARGPDEPDVISTPDTPDRPNWILVADFEGPPDDPDLAVAARELLIASLVQSEIVTPLSKSDLKRGLKLAMKPDTTRIVGEVAKELAVRASARAYLEGRIDRIMKGYSIILTITDADEGHVVTSVSLVAENEEAFIPTLDQLGQELRRNLGEKRSAVQATRLQLSSITGSFEAYRKFVQAFQLADEGKRATSITLLRQALERDPDFALAWFHIGSNYGNLGFVDSAKVAYERALRRPERLLERQRLAVELLLAANRYDFREALRFCELLVSEIGHEFNNHGYVLSNLGRHEEALDVYIRSGDASPFGPSQLILSNQFGTLLRLGRLEEAHQIVQKLEGFRRQQTNLAFHLAVSAWAKAESLAKSLQSNPAVDSYVKWRSGAALASVDATRGAMTSAMFRLERLGQEAHSPQQAQISRFAQVHLFIVGGGTIEFPTSQISRDSTIETMIVEGIRAAVQGEPTTAKQYLHATKRMPTSDRRRCLVDTTLLEAWIAAEEGRSEEVLRLLQVATTQGQGSWFTGPLPIRWLAGTAHEALGHMEDAAASFELALTPGTIDDNQWFLFGIPYAFAHHRLVLLYAKMGRVEDARRHWEIFEKTFTNPDPELVPMVEEARRALEEAEAKS